MVSPRVGISSTIGKAICNHWRSHADGRLPCVWRTVSDRGVCPTSTPVEQISRQHHFWGIRLECWPPYLFRFLASGYEKPLHPYNFVLWGMLGTAIAVLAG